MNIDFSEADLNQVLKMVSEKQGVNLLLFSQGLLGLMGAKAGTLSFCDYQTSTINACDRDLRKAGYDGVSRELLQNKAHRKSLG